MRLVDVLLLSALVPTIIACAIDPMDDDDDDDDDDTTVVTPPDQPSGPTVTRCATVPDAGPSEDWRHVSSNLIAEAGDPHHRGLDLIATTEDAIQTLGGRLTYGPTDKDLEGEDADVFACLGNGAWQKLARVTTDDEGRFTLSLTGEQRLPEGIRDLYLSVAGDRSGVPFVALVAAPGSPVVVSDVDGTLTASENAYPTALVTGDDVAAQPDAAARLNLAVQHGASVVYLTTRGDRFTQDTRTWLAAKGFPFGAVRMPPAIITIPGNDTIEAKTAMLGDLAGFDLLAGVGNRHTDVEAYTNAGIDPAHIFIKLPEFEDELTDDLAQNRATRIDQYIAMPM